MGIRIVEDETLEIVLYRTPRGGSNGIARFRHRGAFGSLA